MPKTADNIRSFGRERYVVPARQQRARRFSIRTGDVVRALKLNDRVRAVCSALKSRSFLESNGLKLVEKKGPPSGQSTTVTYTYEFVDAVKASETRPDPWTELRGVLQKVFAELGGGEAYLRQEREAFYREKKDS
jgi:hypothetical protein